MINKKPNFFVIGAGKSGTTSLFHYLNQHPEVYMSPVKETNFFALEGEDVTTPIDDPDQLKHYPWSVTNREAYADLFKDVESEKAVGEVSPMYLYSIKAATSIKKEIPNAKLIVILRQPTERLYSRYLHLCREDRQPEGGMEEVFDTGSIWHKRNDLVQEGLYFLHLQKYYQLFDPAQIKVVFHEDFKVNSAAVMKDIFEFLSIDTSFKVQIQTQFNASGFIKNRLIDKAIGQNSLPKKVFSNVFPKLSESLFKSHQLKALIERLRAKNLNRPVLSQSLKNQINKAIYLNDITNLESLLKVNLSQWK